MGEIAFENCRFSDFQGLVTLTLTLDRVMLSDRKALSRVLKVNAAVAREFRTAGEHCMCGLCAVRISNVRVRLSAEVCPSSALADSHEARLDIKKRVARMRVECVSE